MKPIINLTNYIYLRNRINIIIFNIFYNKMEVNIDTENKNELLKKINEKLFKNVNNPNVNNNIIFIYAPPKVASTSLVSSLRLFLCHKFNIIHIHDEKMLGNLIHMNIHGITVLDIIHYNKELGKNIYVIDVFRNPIERKISEYFEHLSSLHFNNTDENLKKYPIQKIIDRFNSVYPFIANDDYFMEKYKITVPDTFDFQKKYLFVEENGIKYIKLRMIDIDSWSHILSEIFKTEIIVIKDYETRNKSIGEVYTTFKETYRLPYSYYSLLDESSLLKYYYKEDERKVYLNKWIGKIDNHLMIPYTKIEYDFYLKLSIENIYYNNFIQSNHYMDNGCLCKFCFKKRREVINQLRRGEKIDNERIIHNSDFIKKELIEISIKNIKQKQKQKQNNECLEHNKKIKNILNNIVFTSPF